MANIYPKTTIAFFRNDSMNNSVHANSSETQSFSLKDSDLFHFIMYALLRAPICVVGFIGNFICYNVLKADSRKRHHTATFLLQALAVADNLVLIALFFTSIITGLLRMVGPKEKTISEIVLTYFYVYVSPFLHMAIAGTVWITVLIAINRYIAVCRPFDAQKLASFKRTKTQVAVVSILCIVLTLPEFFQYSITYPEDYDSMTVPFMNETNIGPSKITGKVYDIMLKVISRQILPLILLLIFNTKVIWELKKANKQMHAIGLSRERSEKNITVVMVVIVIVFIVCNLPFQIVLLAWYMNCEFPGIYGLYCVSTILIAANSSTNFILYYVLRKSFRRAFRNAVLCNQHQTLVV